MELLLVIVVVGLLWGSTFLLRLPWDTVFTLGGMLVACGLALGLPASLVYHWALFRALKRKQALPKDWYWRPISLHPLLDPASRPVVLTWCGLGAFGFAVVVLGLIVWGVPVAHLLIQGSPPNEAGAHAILSQFPR